jgi:hypothetical protein
MRTDAARQPKPRRYQHIPGKIDVCIDRVDPPQQVSSRLPDQGWLGLPPPSRERIAGTATGSRSVRLGCGTLAKSQIRLNHQQRYAMIAQPAIGL